MLTNLQRFRLLRIALVLCGAAIVLICASISWGETFALQPGSHNPDANVLEPPRGNRLISVAQLNTPGIDGMTVRYRRGWPLKFIDDSRARVKQVGDRWTLLVCSGESSYYTERYLREWEELIALLGEKYMADPTLWGVHLTGITPYEVSEERHHKISPEIEAADKRLIAAWSRAFPGKKLLFAIGNKDDAGMKRLIQYAVARTPGRVVVKHNAMKATTSLGANHNQLIVWAGKTGAESGFEMARADSNWPKVKANIAALEKQAGRKISYLAPYPPDLAKAGGLK
jgi:hypothetical protein